MLEGDGYQLTAGGPSSVFSVVISFYDTVHNTISLQANFFIITITKCPLFSLDLKGQQQLTFKKFET